MKRKVVLDRETFLRRARAFVRYFDDPVGMLTSAMLALEAQEDVNRVIYVRVGDHASVIVGTADVSGWGREYLNKIERFVFYEEEEEGESA